MPYKGFTDEKKEYCLIGLNRFNLEVGKILVSSGHKVTVLDKDIKKINNFGDIFYQAIVCDVTNIKELQNVGVESFDYVVIGITDVGTSIVTAANLKELGVTNILCKAKDESHKRILKFIGVQTSYIPEEEIAAKVSYKLIHDLNVDSFIVQGNSNNEVLFVKIPLNNSSLWGVQIKDAEILGEIEATIVSIRRRNGEFISPVSGMHRFEEGDIVCLVCKKNDLLETKDKLS